MNKIIDVNEDVAWPPEITVASVIERNNKFLIVEEESSDKVVYNQPAGHLEPKETLVQAAIRETLEETGCEVELTSVVGVYLYCSPSNHRSYLRFCFAGQLQNQNPNAELDEGIIQAVWLSRDELADSWFKLRSPMVLQCIDDYRTGKNYPLDMINHMLAWQQHD